MPLSFPLSLVQVFFPLHLTCNIFIKIPAVAVFFFVVVGNFHSAVPLCYLGIVLSVEETEMNNTGSLLSWSLLSVGRARLLTDHCVEFSDDNCWEGEKQGVLIEIGRCQLGCSENVTFKVSDGVCFGSFLNFPSLSQRLKKKKKKSDTLNQFCKHVL